MKLTGRLASAALRTGEHRTTVMLDVFGDHAAELEAFGDKALDIEIRLHRERRSLRANALCWELCGRIGKALTPPIPKEEVYRKAIRDVGVFVQLSLRRQDWEAFRDRWQSRGTGWFCEISDTHEFTDTYDVIAYCGSSAYDTKAMSTLIDYLVDEAGQMELEIAYDLREIERIKEDWRFIAGQEE